MNTSNEDREELELWIKYKVVVRRRDVVSTAHSLLSTIANKSTTPTHAMHLATIVATALAVVPSALAQLSTKAVTLAPLNGFYSMTSVRDGRYLAFNGQSLEVQRYAPCCIILSFCKTRWRLDISQLWLIICDTGILTPEPVPSISTLVPKDIPSLRVHRMPKFLPVQLGSRRSVRFRV